MIRIFLHVIKLPDEMMNQARRRKTQNTLVQIFCILIQDSEKYSEIQSDRNRIFPFPAYVPENKGYIITQVQMQAWSENNQEPRVLCPEVFQSPLIYALYCLFPYQ